MSRRISPEPVPQPEKARMQCQRVPAEPFGVGALRYLLRSQDITFEVRPAELGRTLVILRIARTPVAAQDPCENFAEQLHQYVGSARCRYVIEQEGGGHQSPQPALFSIGSITCLIAVDNRLRQNVPSRDRDSRFWLSRPTTDRLPTNGAPMTFVLRSPSPALPRQTESRSPAPEFRKAWSSLFRWLTYNSHSARPHRPSLLCLPPPIRSGNRQAKRPP